MGWNDQLSSGLTARVARLDGDVQGLSVFLYSCVGFIHQDVDSVVSGVFDDVPHPFLQHTYKIITVITNQECF